MKQFKKLFTGSSTGHILEKVNTTINSFGRRMNTILQTKCSRISSLHLKIYFTVFGVLVAGYYSYVIVTAFRTPVKKTEIGNIQPPQSLTNAIRFVDSSQFQSRLRIVRFRRYIDSLKTDSLAGPVITKLLSERPGFMDSVLGKEASLRTLP